MRVAVLAGLFAILSTANAEQSREFEKAITSALKWHYRWMEAIPPDSASIKCSLASFEQRSFAYCKRVDVPNRYVISMLIENVEKKLPRVTFLGVEPHRFDNALATFRRNVNRNGRSLGPIHNFTIAVRNLTGCTVDWQLTEHARRVALTKEMHTARVHLGEGFRYPLICKGDPFYLLYSLMKKDIFSIWLYEVDGTQIDLRWTLDHDGQQGRRIPTLAIENLKEEALWYQMKTEAK